MNKSDKLVEATILALQGKLELKEEKTRRKVESIDVNVDDDTIVSVDDNCTTVETEEATVVIEEKPEVEDVVTTEEPAEEETIEAQNDEVEDKTAEEIEEPATEDTVEEVTVEIPVDATIMPEEIVAVEEPTEELPSIDEIVDGETEADEEDLEESKKVTEDVEIEISEDGKEVEVTTDDGEEVEVKDETPDDIEAEEPTEEIDTSIEDEIKDDEESQIEESKCKKSNMEENHRKLGERHTKVQELIKAKKEESRKIKYNTKSFTEALNKYLANKYKIFESAKVSKILRNGKGDLKIEAVITNKTKTTRNICLEMKKVQEGTSFVKYTLKESKGLVKESKSKNTVSMLAIKNRQNVLECRYIISK